MAIWKWLVLLVAALALFLVFQRPRPSASENHPIDSTATQAPKFIEEGRFIVSIQSIKIGEETFSFTQTGNEYFLSSEVSLDLLGQRFQFSQSTELSSNFAPQLYELTALLPQGNQTSTTRFAEGKAAIGLEAEGRIETFEREGRAPWFLADSNIGSHYYLIYHALRARPGESGSFLGTGLVPQTLETFPMELVSQGTAKLRVEQQEIEVTRYQLKMGEFEVALYGRDDIFFLAELISQQTTAYRSDLFPKRPQIIDQP